MATEGLCRGHVGLGAPASAAPVVIVGAGVCGLTVALRLAALGTPSTVLERRRHTAPPASRPPGSAGDLVQPSDLGIWDHADRGVRARIETLGTRCEHAELRWGRRLVHDIPAGQGDGGRRPVALPRPSLRGTLLQAARRNDLVDIRFGARVLGVIQGPDDVTLVLDEDVVRAPWVVAADGPRSILRLSLGIAQSSMALRHVMVTLDLHGDRSLSPLGATTISWFSPPSDRRSHLLVTPQPDDVWRLDWTYPHTVDLEADERSGQLGDRVSALIGSSGWTLSTATIKRVARHVAVTYRRGRVLLVGEAAHQVTAPGGTGLGEGLRDAAAAADTLAITLREPQVAESVLDRYATARREAALAAAAGRLRAVRRRVPDAAPGRVFRSAALVAAPWSSAAQRYLGHPPSHTLIDGPPDDVRPRTATVPAPSSPPDAGHRQRERV
ncbi:MAG: FAD-dependent monooxygenase [Kineosporiaceae bacterium]